MPRPLPLRRIVKPCHSRHFPVLQLQYFQHLRGPLLTPFPAISSRPQGGGSPWFTLSGVEGSTNRRSSLSAVDCQLSASLGPLLLSPLFPLLTQKQAGVPPRENVGAPTFLIFPLIFCTFLALSAGQRVARHVPASGGGRYKTEEGGLKPPLQGKRGTEHGPRPILRDTGHGPRINLHLLALSLAEGSLATGH